MARCGGGAAPKGPSLATLERHRLKEALAEQLRQDLSRLLAEGTCSDVTICAGDSELRAHRAVLMARAPWLFAILGGGQSARDVLRLDGVGPAEIRRFLRLVYASDKKEDEELAMMKKVLEPKLIQENNTAPLQNTQTNVDCVGDSKRTHIDQNTVSEAVQEVTCIEEKIPEIAIDAESNKATTGNSKLETASALGEDLMMLYKKCCCPDINICIEGKVFQAHRYSQVWMDGCFAG